MAVLCGKYVRLFSSRIFDVWSSFPPLYPPFEGLTFMVGWVPGSEEKCFVERKR